jgi:hypothetical protein
MTALHTAIGYFAPLADPSPGDYNGPAVGTGAPPGGEKFSTILGWVAWTATGACVLGVLITAIMLGVAHNRGGAGEHGMRLLSILFACILIGSASAIVGALS